MKGFSLKKNSNILIIFGFTSLLLSQDVFEGYTLFTPGGGGGGGGAATSTGASSPPPQANSTTAIKLAKISIFSFLPNKFIFII